MSSNETIDDLRKRLFEAMDGVKDGTVSLDKARVLVEIGQVMVNSAKAENEFLRITESTESQFLGAARKTGLPQLGNGITAVRRHLIKDD